ncbi:MAG: hypothetical protein V4501_01915 [Pseudomonadota bacterium]
MSSTRKDKRKITIGGERRSRLFEKDNKDGEPIQQESQVSSLSSFDNSQSPTNRGRAPRRSSSVIPAAFFHRSASNVAADEETAQDEKAEKLEDAQETKRRKIAHAVAVAVTQPETAKTAFKEALAEFYAKEIVQGFNQRQLAAGMVCWFAEALEKPNILVFARATPTAGRVKRAKENSAYNNLLGLMTMHGYGTAFALRADKVKEKFETYMHKNLRIYASKPLSTILGKFEEPYHSYRKVLREKLKDKPNLAYETSAMIPHLLAFDKEIIKKITAALPADFENNERKFVESFFEEKLRQIEGYFHLRAAKFIACLMEEFGKVMDKHRSTQSLGTIFKSRGAELTRQFEISVEAPATSSLFLPASSSSSAYDSDSSSSSSTNSSDSSSSYSSPRPS